VGHPVKFSELPRPEPKPAPELGEHSSLILREFGFTAAEIDALIRDQVVVQAS
jgi:crotonobetainyl-CoA:carnitine CoA-transferase CaiB-like acyl-CoA transferase